MSETTEMVAIEAELKAAKQSRAALEKQIANLNARLTVLRAVRGRTDERRFIEASKRILDHATYLRIWDAADSAHQQERVEVAHDNARLREQHALTLEENRSLRESLARLAAKGVTP